MAPGVFRITGISIGAISQSRLPLRRVNGVALVPHTGELMRFYAEHDDPWFEIDLDEVDVPIAHNKVEIAVELQRVGLAQSLERRLEDLMGAIRALSDAGRP